MKHLTEQWAKVAKADDLEDLIDVLERRIERVERNGPEAEQVYAATDRYIREYGPGEMYYNNTQVGLALWKIIKAETGVNLTMDDLVVQMPQGPGNTASAAWIKDPARPHGGWAYCAIGSAAMANQVVVIHEAVHIILGMRGQSDKHGPRFQALNDALMVKHMGRGLAARLASQVRDAPATGPLQANFPGSRVLSIPGKGSLQYSVGIPEDPGGVVIHATYVEPGARRQGVATLLHDALAKQYAGHALDPGGLTPDGERFWHQWVAKNGWSEVNGIVWLEDPESFYDEDE